MAERGDHGFRPGVAPVGPRRASGEPTLPLSEQTMAEQTMAGQTMAGQTMADQGWTGPGPPWRPQPAPSLRFQARQLKRGGEWSAIGGLFTFVSWGIWAISGDGTTYAGPIITFVLVLLVGAGVFALCRLLGKMVLVRWLGRIRRSAWPSHLVTGVFLVAAGVQYLRQTSWVIDAWIWVRGLG